MLTNKLKMEKIDVPRGAVGRIAERLSVSKDYVRLIQNGVRRDTPKALRILDELRQERDLFVARLNTQKSTTA